MRSVEALERAWQSCPPAPRGFGHVRLIVARRGQGEHEVLGQAELSERRGLVGDRWEHASKPSRVRQVTLMNVDAARIVADGTPLHLPGDNFLVDLDLSDEAAPAGTRLRLGTALLEITATPHLGCKKFQQRFGADAMRWVNDEQTATRRLRGVNCRILASGAVWVGDTVCIEPS